jgi:hypothetical protein
MKKIRSRKGMKRLLGSEIPLLLGLLLLFSASVGMLYGDKIAGEKVKQKKHIKKNKSRFEKWTAEEGISHLYPLIISRGVTKIIEFFKQVAPGDAVSLIEAIVDDKNSPLVPHDNLQIIFSVARHYEKHRKIQAKLFNLIIAYEDAQSKKIPLLALVVKTGNASIIPAILVWQKKNKKKKDLPLYVQNIAVKGLMYSTRHDDVAALKTYEQNGIKISSKKSSQLLSELIRANGTISTLPFFLAHGADVDYVDKQKYTPLIRATYNNNLVQIRALVDAGAAVNKLTDLAIGTALQIALEKTYVEIELFLRSKGAKE